MFNFEKWKVWKKSLDFADLVYAASGTFPNGGRFGLIHQLRRAALSISSHVAEGRSRSSWIDDARFVELASGSHNEVVSQGCVAKRQNFLTSDAFDALYSAAEELSRMLSGLRSFLTTKS